jgi:hypothetical protein
MGAQITPLSGNDTRSAKWWFGGPREGEGRVVFFSPGVPDHKGHLLRGDHFGGDDKVAFIFAVSGVQDDNKFSVFYNKIVTD